jgi:hypothetical protein
MQTRTLGNSVRAPLAARGSLAALLVVAAASLLAAPRPAAAEPEEPHLRSTPEDRREVAITVYNQDFGLVRETRSVELARGPVALEFEGVASTIQPETVAIRSLAGEGALRVLEQNYRYDLLSPQKLLEKYVGRQVKVYRWNDVTGREEERPAEVLSTNGGTVLRIGDEITFDYPGRIGFPEIPENLIARPSLVWQLDSAAEHQDIEVSYLANALGWSADYVLVLSPDDTKGDLTGWVTLDNRSGASYENAKLALVAGDVQRVQPKGAVVYNRMRALGATPEAAPQFREEPLFEYHLYTLERPATLLDNEKKQITLLQAPEVGLEKHFELRGQAQWFRAAYGQPMESKRKVSVLLELENREANGLGMPLPKGVVRVYKEDGDGGRQFVGEDEIDHTPRDERVRVKLGEAFDVVADRRQTEWQERGRCGSESSFEIELRNHKDTDVEVEVIEPAMGEWEILRSSHPYVRKDAHSFSFTPKVPAHGEATVTYTARVRWC